MSQSKQSQRASTQPASRRPSKREKKQAHAVFVPEVATPLPCPATPTPLRRSRTPKRCTMGHQYYDERRGEQVLGYAVPKLRLSGRWLEQCGFAVGDVLQVTVGRGLLLISRRK